MHVMLSLVFRDMASYQSTVHESNIHVLVNLSLLSFKLKNTLEVQL